MLCVAVGALALAPHANAAWSAPGKHAIPSSGREDRLTDPRSLHAYVRTTNGVKVTAAGFKTCAKTMRITINADNVTTIRHLQARGTSCRVARRVARTVVVSLSDMTAYPGYVCRADSHGVSCRGRGTRLVRWRK